MDTIYWIIIAVLLLFAIFDLVVGVSNDAVNFLNSAIGSRVAPIKVILLVASAGIIIGALFSNGMMEIARSGVIVPQHFHYHSVMLMFLSVMITVGILLDLYNTFGLPTSTTVSLVFALMGAAVTTAVYEKAQLPADSKLSLIDYIHSAKALQMITAILCSVVIAFFFGTVVMYVSRIIFSFHYKRPFRYLGAIWCGVSLTAITYYAIFKGLKGSSIISPEDMLTLDQNMHFVLPGLFMAWTVLMAILQFIFRVNILKVIILTGTFTLALAFAGNDLVNFIGVFMAGLASFEIAQGWISSGNSVDTLMMGGLAAPAQASSIYLVCSGFIMVAAIWLSKKSRSVSETEVNLASQKEDTIEHFGSVPPARAIVRASVNMGKWFSDRTPPPLKKFIDGRFVPKQIKDTKLHAPFDHIRASVNLTLAALLISIATSYKLPLSTTYVTFMVAMGSSLADRAWGRESAVYRVTGVLTVISGWFMTAFLAFALAALIALLLMYGGIYAIFIIIGLTVTMVIRSSIIHKKRSQKFEKPAEEVMITETTVLAKCSQDLVDSLGIVNRIYTGVIDAIFTEDRKKLQELLDEAKEFRNTIKDRRKFEVLPTLHQLQAEKVETAHYYVRVLDYLNEVSKCLLDFSRSGYSYIDNTHSGFTEEQLADLKLINDAMANIYEGFAHVVATNDYSKLRDILMERDKLFELFAEIIKRQIVRTCNKECSPRNSMLYLDILNEAKNMALQCRSLIKAQRYLMEPLPEELANKRLDDPSL